MKRTSRNCWQRFCWPAPARAQEKAPCAVAGENNDFLGIQTIRLWPGDAPQAKGKACEDTPTLTIFEPQHGPRERLRGGGSAGRRLSRVWPPTWRAAQVADWFTARGFRAFVLSYRLSFERLPAAGSAARRAARRADGAGAGRRLPDRPQSHCDDRLLRRRPSGRAGRHAVCSRQPGRRRPHRARLQPPGLSGARLSVDRRHLQRYLAPELLQALQRDGPLRGAAAGILSGPVCDQRDAAHLLVPHLRRRDWFRWSRGCASTRRWSRPECQPRRIIFAKGPHGTGLGKGDAALDQWPALLETWLRARGC